MSVICPRCRALIQPQSQFDPRLPLVLTTFGEDHHCTDCEWDLEEFTSVNHEEVPAA